MDFAAWVNDARRFAESMETLEGVTRFELDVAPPLPPEEIEQLSPKWPTGIPKPLQEFWCNGSQHFHCRYVWNPPPTRLLRLKSVFPSNNYIYGGPRFESASEIYPSNSGVEPGDTDMQEEIGDDAYRLWCEASVIMHVGNGDLIALDQTADPVDPPVMYLSHDDESSAVISSSLADFLTSWARLCYIGPEIWLLEYWLDESSGLIDTDRHLTSELRDLLLN